MQKRPLTIAGEEFFRGVESALLEVRQGGDTTNIKEDAFLEAFRIVAAMVDVDGFHTDKELSAMFDAMPAAFEQFGDAASFRDSKAIRGARVFFNLPSKLLGELLRHDEANKTTYSWWYYERAIRLVETVGAIDLEPTPANLNAIERFRTAMLTGMEIAGVHNPATHRKVATTMAPSSASQSNRPMSPPRPLEDLLAELNGLIGLDSVKNQVKLVANYIQVQNLRAERGLSVVDAGRHLVFTGNPGTGKTTVARLVAEIYRSLRVVRSGHLVETDRSGLVAGYVGQTAIQVAEVFKNAIGGVLLIDEAYALSRGAGTLGAGDYGQEAIDTLVKLMEDHREEVVVIVAGYPQEMKDFIASNPGLASRFPTTIDFPDYASDELVRIFEGLCRKNDYGLTLDARVALGNYFESQPRAKGFGNGRLARNIFEASLAKQAGRIVALSNPSEDDLRQLWAEDLALEDD